MLPAEYFLKELLFDYDCVTIPGLGGFIMQSQPARIDRGKNRISPPSRYPSFNSLLIHDDGLLISAIARAEHLSYRDAGLIVSDFAEDIKRRISFDEKIILEGIGELSSGPEGGIRFRELNPSNFFAGVFGMKPLNLYPLAKPQYQARLTQKPADRTSRQLRERKPAAVKWTLMLSVPVILFLLYGIIFPSSLQNFYTNYSGIIFDLAHPHSIRQPIAIQVDKKDPVALYEATLPDAPVIKTPAINIKEKTTVAAETVLQKSQRYYIIGGCFENEDNAGRFLTSLIKRGFEAEKAGTTGRGHVRISYKSFTDKESALPYLQQIRYEENTSAWLLKY